MSDTLLISGMESVMTSTGKQKFNVQTDKGIFTMWDAELAGEIQHKGYPQAYECKTSEKIAPNGFKYRNILDAFPVQGSGSTVGSQSPYPAKSSLDSESRTIEIRSQVAFKGAIELICAGKSDKDVRNLTTELYLILKDIASIEVKK